MLAERQVENGNTSQDNYLRQTEQCLTMLFVSFVRILLALMFQAFLASFNDTLSSA